MPRSLASLVLATPFKLVSIRYGADPNPAIQWRAMHDHLRCHGKVTSVDTTSVQLGTSILSFGEPCRIAMYAPDTIRPATYHEQRFRVWFIGCDMGEELRVR